MSKQRPGERWRHYANPEIQLAYHTMRSAAPATREGIAAAYWKGFEHPDEPSTFDRNSPLHGAWAAGIDTARNSQTNGWGTGKIERNRAIFERRLNGETLSAIAAEFGISVSRVRQIAVLQERRRAAS